MEALVAIIIITTVLYILAKMIEMKYMDKENVPIKIGPIIGKPELGMVTISSVLPIKALSMARQADPKVRYAATSAPKQA